MAQLIIRTTYLDKQTAMFWPKDPWVLEINTSGCPVHWSTSSYIWSSHLFQDAVSSVSFWLRSFPVCGWRTRLLSSVSGLPTRWRCVCGWLMHLLWAYEHDFVVISPFLYERIGTLYRHPCWSLCKQRIAGWRSGRSEGYCKSLSAGHTPTDLLLLKQRTSRPVPGWFRWSVPRGAQHLIRCAICR